MENKTSNFIKNEVLKLERNSFIIGMLFTVIGYVGITLWLNAIRATAQIWFVWVLIIIQFALYFSIFIKSFKLSKTCGLNNNFGVFLFTILAILGRVNDWELVVIPVLVLVMIIISIRNKNVSPERKHLISETK
ncbi:MAG: hypothetical protein V1848_04005 [Candidatus Magasanikbacteria bacterium]